MAQYCQFHGADSLPEYRHTGNCRNHAEHADVLLTTPGGLLLTASPRLPPCPALPAQSVFRLLLRATKKSGQGFCSLTAPFEYFLGEYFLGEYFGAAAQAGQQSQRLSALCGVKKSASWHAYLNKPGSSRTRLAAISLLSGL